MKIAGVVILLLAGFGVAYYCFVPPHTFIIFHRPDGSTVSFSRWKIEFEGPPDRYATGAFNQLESYVSRLMAHSSKRRWVSIFTPAGDRGFALSANDGTIEAHLSVEWREEPQREAAIRAFFGSRGLSPTEDYLAGNGDVPDASRLLAYPLAGSASEVAALAQRILEDLCGVSSTEPLNIRYSER
jgi:hypothetical protein